MLHKLKNLKFAVIIIFIFLVIIILISCSPVYKQLSKISSMLNLNYPGLRFETRITSDDCGLKKIICFGDSVTFGWNIKYTQSFPYLLGEKLSPCGYVSINSGIGGNTILDAYSRLERDIIDKDPYLVIINFGLNDGKLIKSAIKSKDGVIFENISGKFTTAVSINDFNRYYSSIIEKLKENDIKVVALGINPVTDYFPAGMDNDFRLKQKQIYKLFNDEIIKTAEKEGVAYIDLWEYFSDIKDLKYYMDQDALHPNYRGANVIYEIIYDYLISNEIIKCS